jgi:electron transport complex protein RnfE
MATKKSLGREFSKGILKDNPLLVLLLGLCPSLAVTTSAINGLGMGLAATFVLVMSNMIISLLRKVIPDQVRIPAYITIIASLVTMVQFVLQGYVPALNQALGIFIPLITVNCIILGRAEAFANRNTVGASVMDGLGMGVGFTTALFLIGATREILGNGSIFGYALPFVGEGHMLKPIMIFAMPPGGFAVFGLLIAIAQKLNNRYYATQPLGTMDRAHFPGSISARTDTAMHGTEKRFPEGASGGQVDGAVPETIKDAAALEEKK